jgi:hypothetical protein
MKTRRPGARRCPCHKTPRRLGRCSCGWLPADDWAAVERVR